MSEDLKLLSEQKPEEHFQRRLKEAEGHCREAWERAAKNQRFVFPGTTGSQWGDYQNEYRKRRKASRPAFTINDIALAVNTLAGREITARFQPAFFGRAGGRDNAFAEIVQEFSRKIRDVGDFESTESDAFRDLHIEGYAWVEWFQDFMLPPLGVGRTRIEHPPLWEMLWPESNERNLRDRLWEARGRWISYEEFLGMFPGEEETEKARLGNRGSWVGEKESRSHRWPWLYVGEGHYVNRKRKEVFLANYDWRERELRYQVEIPARLFEPLGIEPSESEVAAGFLEKIVGRDELVAIEKVAKATGLGRLPRATLATWRYRRSYFAGDKQVGEAEDLPYDGFTRLCMTGYPYRNYEETIFYSTVDLMSDPTAFKNIVISLMLSVLAHSAKGPTFVEAGAFRYPAKARDQLALPGAYIELNPGGKAKIHEGTTAQWPSGLEGYLRLADQAVWKAFGGESALGFLEDPRRVSGRVMARITEAAGQVFSYPFDALRMLRRDSGYLMMHFMHAQYDETDVARIVGEEKTVKMPTQEEIAMAEAQGLPAPEPIRLLPPRDQWDEMFEFDVKVEEVPTSKTEQLEFWDFLTRTDAMTTLLTGGQMPIDLVVDAAPISEGKKDFWRNWLRKQEAAQAAQATPPSEPPIE